MSQSTSQKTPGRAHVVALRYSGEVVSYQLRRGRGGPGETKSFSVNKYGGPRKALRAAMEEAKAQGLIVGQGRGGAPKGQPNVRSSTPAAGIRFVWEEFSESAVLYVVASWTSPEGKPAQSSWSTARHGLEGALDRAIEKRVASGAPDPDKKALMRVLRATYKSRT